MEAFNVALLASLGSSAAKVALVLGAALVFTRLLRGAAAATRHLALFAALLSALALPALAPLLPATSLAVPFLRAEARPPVPLPAPADALVIDASPPAARTPAPVAPSAQAPAAAPLRLPIATLLFGLWALGSLLLLSRLAWGTILVRRAVRSSTPVRDPEWLRLFAEARALLDLRGHVRLLQSAATDVPLACGLLKPAVLVPPDAASWPEARRRAVLLHELAHVERRDPLTQLVAQVARALHFWNPLAWLAERALRDERERACDDRALSAGETPEGYATALVEVASSLSFRPPLLAPAMAHRSLLEERLTAVLDAGKSRRGATRKAALVTLLAAAVLVLPLASVRAVAAEPDEQAATPPPPPSKKRVARPPVRSFRTLPPDAPEAPRAPLPPAAAEEEAAPLPPRRPRAPRAPLPPPPPRAFASADDDDDDLPPRAATPAVPAAPAAPAMPADPAAPPEPPEPPQPPEAPEPPEPPQANLSHRGASSTWSSSWSDDNGDGGSLVVRGALQLRAEGDDGLAIESLGRGGSFELSWRRGGELRQISLRDERGGLSRSLRVNGRERPWDAAADAWFASALTDLDRRSGFAIDLRYPRIFQRGGAPAVLAEVQKLGSDFVRAIWLQRLLTFETLDEPARLQVIDVVRASMHSDYERARVLMALAARSPLRSEAERAAFLAAADGLASDFEHARVLAVLLAQPSISAGLAIAALKSAARMSSDFEKTRTLYALVASLPPDAGAAYVAATRSIRSDFERGRALQGAVHTGKLVPADLRAAVASADEMRSDFEKARVLLAILNAAGADAAVRADVAAAARRISSSFERDRVLARASR